MSHPRLATDGLRRRARELGFDLFGVAPARPLEVTDFYARWVALGHAGEMTYLERAIDRRRDPGSLLAGARTVICLGMHYARAPAPGQSDRSRGRVAGYALGDDYHDLVRNRLRRLFEYLVQHVDAAAQGRWFVDTAPVLERPLAQRAGLGWQGKNTCLIHKRRGSTFFLAELVTTASLACDEPAVDHCGTCTRCLDACPTQAFVNPRELDARRCIAYLTIELRGAIPPALRPRMGTWIFGCDVCQDVCPWNRRAPAAAPALGVRPELAAPDLLELIRLDQAGFAARFRHHAGKRPGRRGMLRNVAVALGNAGGPEAVPVLGDVLLREEEALVRAHVAWALGHIGGEAARRALHRARRLETDGEVKKEIDDALRECSLRTRRAGAFENTVNRGAARRRREEGNSRQQTASL